MSASRADGRPASGPVTTGSAEGAALPSPWDETRARLHARGLRWTPQRRALVTVLAGTHGHVATAEIVERCRALDPETTPSTVYRTLDVLEELGLVRHAHGPDGREEIHVLPSADHGHLHCDACGGRWEIGAAEAAALIGGLAERHGFRVDLSHLVVVGRCAACSGSG
ncbi:MAG: Fur family transcriptional regulator [Chloroflexota bacterium]